MDRLELPNLRLILRIQVSVQNKLTFSLTLSFMAMPSCGFGDYMSILTNEQFVAALHEGFVDAQATCAQLGMKPMKTSPKCQWKTPWKHERHMEAQLYRDMGEEECDINHVLGSARLFVVDERGPSVEDNDIDPIVFDEHAVTNVSTIECE